MTVYNLGSINVDQFWHVPTLPRPGETLVATDLLVGLGGKGLNMSAALARAGGSVLHIGAIGIDGDRVIKKMAKWKLSTKYIERVQHPTGTAFVMIEAAGENMILILSGANMHISNSMIDAALDYAKPTDWLLMQNETNGHRHAIKRARAIGMKIAYAAAPFDADRVKEVLPHIDLLFLNEIEAEQLTHAIGRAPTTLDVPHVVMTMGPKGARCFDNTAGTYVDINAPSVTAVDTTGAGDTFTGYAMAALDRGESIEDAAEQAIWAGSLMVTKNGTADAIPSASEVQRFKDDYLTRR